MTKATHYKYAVVGAQTGAFLGFVSTANPDKPDFKEAERKARKYGGRVIGKAMKHLDEAWP